MKRPKKITKGPNTWAKLFVTFVLLCGIAKSQQPPVKSEGNEASKTGSITGRVVNESGQPLPNASVSVQAIGAARVNQSATTDRDGAFKVSGLKPVPYQVYASMPAYISASGDLESDLAKRYKIGDVVRFVLIKGGVITGTVTTAAGDPVVGIEVRARMIRDGNGKRIISAAMVYRSSADDRGIYRVYGLPTGTYIVVAGSGHSYGNSGGNAFDTYLPTYAHSSTRDTATEFEVRTGQETSNVDIRYRAEPGRTISGIARGSRAGEVSDPTIHLTSITAGGSQSNLYYFQRAGSPGFVFFGIADGDYYLTARLSRDGREQEISESMPIKVRGADIEGIELTTRPMGAINGRVVLEESKPAECSDKDRPLFAETFIYAFHKETEAAKNQPQFIWSLGEPVSPDPQGNIFLKNLAPGEYYFATRFAAKSWYLQSITFGPGSKPVDATRVWTNVKSGDRRSGLTITLAQGAASLHGQLALAEGATRPERLSVYLVPAEREKADEVLRFYGTAVTSEGKIVLNNLAPGRYWVLVQPAIDGASSLLVKLRLPDETENRAKLRRDADVAKLEIELKPCQNVSDFQLKAPGQ